MPPLAPGSKSHPVRVPWFPTPCATYASSGKLPVLWAGSVRGSGLAFAGGIELKRQRCHPTGRNRQTQGRSEVRESLLPVGFPASFRVLWPKSDRLPFPCCRLGSTFSPAEQLGKSCPLLPEMLTTCSRPWEDGPARIPRTSMRPAAYHPLNMAAPDQEHRGPMSRQLPVTV